MSHSGPKDAIRSTTSWPATPTPISSAVKVLINRFSLLVNDRSDDGSRLYSEVFTPTGTWRSPGRAYTGSKVSGSTANSWSGLSYRVHEVRKVYFFDDAVNDLMMFGKAEYGLENGAKVDTEFSARCVIDDPRSETPRLELFQGWTVRFFKCSLLRPVAGVDLAGVELAVGA